MKQPATGGSPPQAGSPGSSVKLSSLVSSGQILCGLRDTGMERMVHHLIGLIGADDPSLDIEHLYRRILAREKCGVWLICPGVALVHAPVGDRIRQSR